MNPFSYRPFDSFLTTKRQKKLQVDDAMTFSCYETVFQDEAHVKFQTRMQLLLLGFNPIQAGVFW